MEVTIEDISTVKKILHIEVPNDMVMQEINNAYDTLKKTAKLKGFRQGKIPRSVLERYFKKDVHADVSNKLLKDSFIDAVREKNLKIVGDLKIEPVEIDEKSPYKYEATIEIRPEISGIEFKGLNLKKNVYNIGEKEVEAQLKLLQKNLSQQKTIEEIRPAANNDYALITYEGLKDGQPFEETAKTENYTMKIGLGHFTKDFDDQVVGMKPGENKKISINFPEDYFNSRLANINIVFDVTLNEIREEILPEINDEFAKNFGEFKTLEELKDKIKENLTQGYEKRVEQEINEQIFTELISKTQFEVPETMIGYELENIIAEAERSFAYHNTSLEALGLTKESLSEKYRDVAEKQAKRHLILDKIIEQEKLSLKDEEMQEGFKKISEDFQQPLEEIKEFYSQNMDRLNYFKQTLLEKNAINLILENSNIENVEAVLETGK
ncbi:trigger factor [Desulfobacterium sp. N47]